MSAPLDTLLRFERGELPLGEADAVRHSVASDEEARVWLDWIAALRRASESAVDEAGGPAPDPIEIAALAEGSLPAPRAREVRAALAASAEGYAMFEAAVAEVRAAPVAAPEAEGPSFLRLVRDPRAWILAAAAVLLLVLFGPTEPAPGDPTLLARRQALEVVVLRGADDALARGLAAYEEAAYGDAVTELSAATGAAPGNGEAWLYLGSALLLLGSDAEALAALETAATTAVGTFGEEARWQLAQARLANEDVDSALALLEGLVGGGHRAGDARDQLAELAAWRQ